MCIIHKRGISWTDTVGSRLRVTHRAAALCPENHPGNNHLTHFRGLVSHLLIFPPRTTSAHNGRVENARGNPELHYATWRKKCSEAESRTNLPPCRAEIVAPCCSWQTIRKPPNGLITKHQLVQIICKFLCPEMHLCLFAPSCCKLLVKLDSFQPWR